MADEIKTFYSQSGSRFCQLPATVFSVVGENRDFTNYGFRVIWDLRRPLTLLVSKEPTVLPSTSANHAKVPLGISTGGTTIFPPSASLPEGFR
jgi:hypothetical protein